MIGIRGMPIIKAWSLVGHPPEGPAVYTNPPESHFMPDGEMDIPAFAHNGRGQHLEGQFDIGEHGEHVYRTGSGDFRHGMDAVIHHTGEFLRARGLPVSSIEVVNNALKHFNETHSNKDAHEANDTSSKEWRKIRGNALPPGDSTETETNRPVRTHSGNKITMLTNKNHEQTPMGKFLESYYVPFNQSLMKELKGLGIPESEIKQALPFTKYPYIYAHMTAPEGFLRSHAKQHPSEADASMMGHAPEGYYGDTTNVHTWEVAHHLPDIFYYPNLKQNMQKKGKAPTKLYQAAHAMIDQAMQQGLDHIPNMNVTINRGSMAAPDMINRPLHEILQTPDLRDAMVKDMAHVPAMMFLFGRSGQGDFHKLYNHMMTKYGANEDSLSLDEQAKYLRAGEKGGQGMHTSAKRLFALARASGEGSEEGRSRFGEHKITADELKAANVHYSDPLMLQVNRFRGVIEALADHQASARGHEAKRGLGEIPTEPMKTYDIHGYPMMDDATGEYSSNALESHMDDYIYDMHHFAPTKGFDPSLSPTKPTVPTESELPPVTTTTDVPPAGAAPLPPQSVGTPPRFQDVRQQIGGYNPAQFREMMQAAGRAPVARPTSPELSPIESRAQAGLADPRQRLLSQYYKSEDVMDRVMAVLKGRR